MVYIAVVAAVTVGIAIGATVSAVHYRRLHRARLIVTTQEIRDIRRLLTECQRRLQRRTRVGEETGQRLTEIVEAVDTAEDPPDAPDHSQATPPG